MWYKKIIRFRKIIALMISISLFITPVIAGATTARQSTEQIKNLNIKELSATENPEIFEQLSNNKSFKVLKKELFNGGKHKSFESRMLTIVDPSDNKPVYCLVTPYVKDDKPGIMGIVFKDGNTFVASILGEDSTTDGINVSVMTVDDNDKIIKQIKKVATSNNRFASILIGQANAMSPYDFCVNFCNAMCSMGLGFGGCYLLCTGISAGTGVLLCGFLCAAFTWNACNWGCPPWCSYIMR